MTTCPKINSKSGQKRHILEIQTGNNGNAQKAQRISDQLSIRQKRFSAANFLDIGQNYMNWECDKF